MPHEAAVDIHPRDLSAPDLLAILQNTSVKVGNTEFTSHYGK